MLKEKSDQLELFIKEDIEVNQIEIKNFFEIFY